MLTREQQGSQLAYDLLQDTEIDMCLSFSQQARTVNDVVSLRTHILQILKLTLVDTSFLMQFPQLTMHA